MTPKCVLSIAGSDPSGGAGIQADLKTFAAFGVYGAAVPACLTVQNTRAVTDSLFLPAGFVRAQLQAVLDDIPLAAVKIGMLGTAEIAKSVGECLAEWTDGRNPALPAAAIVCDPVMISKSGFMLLKEDTIQALGEYVIPVATVLTPNRFELERLAALVGGPELSHVGSAEALLDRFANLQAVLVKGGHLEEESDTVTDTLVLRHGEKNRHIAYSHKRIRTGNTHGTGCTLSSAIAALLALGSELSEAVQKAVAYVEWLIAYSANHPLGGGHGPLFHHAVRQGEIKA